jgi:hypothetical protein
MAKKRNDQSGGHVSTAARALEARLNKSANQLANWLTTNPSHQPGKCTHQTACRHLIVRGTQKSRKPLPGDCPGRILRPPVEVNREASPALSSQNDAPSSTEITPKISTSQKAVFLNYQVRCFCLSFTMTLYESSEAMCEHSIKGGQKPGRS